MKPSYAKLLIPITLSVAVGCINSNNTAISIQKKKVDATVSCVQVGQPSDPDEGDAAPQWGNGGFEPTRANPVIAASLAPAQMVWIPGGEFRWVRATPRG